MLYVSVVTSYTGTCTAELLHKQTCKWCYGEVRVRGKAVTKFYSMSFCLIYSKRLRREHHMTEFSTGYPIILHIVINGYLINKLLALESYSGGVEEV